MAYINDCKIFSVSLEDGRTQLLYAPEGSEDLPGTYYRFLDEQFYRELKTIADNASEKCGEIITTDWGYPKTNPVSIDKANQLIADCKILYVNVSPQDSGDTGYTYVEHEDWGRLYVSDQTLATVDNAVQAAQADDCRVFIIPEDALNSDYN